MKKILSAIIAACFVLCAAACSTTSADATSKSVTVSWNGNWATDDGFMAADISGNKITINIVDAEREQKSLYWKGTWDSSAALQKGTQITSIADIGALSDTLLGSQDTTKKFTYNGRLLSYTFSALGVTQTMHIRRS